MRVEDLATRAYDLILKGEAALKTEHGIQGLPTAIDATSHALQRPLQPGVDQ